MKKRSKKLALHRETLRSLTGEQLAGARGQGPDYTLTCPQSGCYVCTGLGCTGNCPEDTIFGVEG